MKHCLVITGATAQPDFGFNWIILDNFLKECIKSVCAGSVLLRMENE